MSEVYIFLALIIVYLLQQRALLLGKIMGIVALAMEALSCQAASTASLTFSSITESAACKLTVSTPRIDYGDVHIGDLNSKEGVYYLAGRKVGFSIHCEAPAKTALTAQATSLALHSYAGIPAEYLSSLGRLQGEDIGVFTLDLVPGSTILDGHRHVQGLHSKGHGEAWYGLSQNSEFRTIKLNSETLLSWGDAMGLPSAAKTVDGEFIVKPLLFKKAIEFSHSGYELEGGVNLTLYYL